MAFLNWFQKFCAERGLGELTPEVEGGAGGAGGAKPKADLLKEVVFGEGGYSKESSEIVVRFAIEAQSSASLLSLECKVASLPHNPFRREAFLLQRLRLNAPHETGLSGYLALRGAEIIFRAAWREQRQAGGSAQDASLLLENYLARARRFRKIFQKFTREQLRTEHEEDILALERERGGSEQARLATFKL